LIITGGLVVYGILSAANAQAQPETATEADSTAAGDDSWITAKGQIIPLRHAALSFQIGGQINEILVSEGEAVEAGASLLRLEDAAQRIAVSQAEAQLAQAQAALQTGESRLAAAQAELATKQLAAGSAQTQLAILTADPSAQQIAALEEEVNVAEANIGLAAANRDTMLQPPAASEIYAAQSKLSAAEAARQPIQVARDQLPEDADAETVALLDSQLNAAQAEVNAAQAILDQLQGGTAASVQQAANGGVGAAVARRDAAQARLDLLLAGPKPEQVRVAEVRVSQAESMAAQAELAVRQAEIAVLGAEAGVERAQIALQAAQAALEQTILKAPFAGTITHLPVEVGEVAGPEVAAVTVADLSDWQVETSDLSELDVAALAVGLPVSARLESLADETINGRIVDIAAVSQLVQGDITYVVTIQLDDSDAPLRWGMTTAVEIEVD
jgi:multidrug resistance efflux pump